MICGVIVSWNASASYKGRLKELDLFRKKSVKEMTQLALTY